MKRFLILLTLLAAPAYAQARQDIKSGGPVDITAAKLDVEQSKGLATFSGDVVVTQSNFRLEAPTVTADYSGGGKGGAQSEIKSITATGGVTITRAGQGGTAEKATGSTATYTPGDQQLTLTGDVTLIRGPSSLSGDKLVYDIGSGNARVTNSKGPVKARFVPGGK